MNDSRLQVEGDRTTLTGEELIFKLANLKKITV